MRVFKIILFVFLSTLSYSAFGQLQTTKHYSAHDWLCSKGIILDSSGYFFREWGCEGRSNISFGRYKIGNSNKIIFQYLPFDSISPIKKIAKGNKYSEKDTFVTITFYDRYGEPLSTNLGIRIVDTSNKVHEMWTDEKGQLEVNRNIYKSVILIQLLTLYGQAEGITIGKEPLFVHFNLPKLFLQYLELKLDKPIKENLQLKEKGLYSPISKKMIYKQN